MYGFFDDHYIYEYVFDQAAPVLTLREPAPVKCLMLFEYGNRSDDGSPARVGHLRPGSYLVAASNELQLLWKSDRFEFTKLVTSPASADITAITHTDQLIAYGDDKGGLYIVQLDTLQTIRTKTAIPATVTSIHVAGKRLVATSINGSWYMFGIHTLPEPPEEINSRELAHTGAINSAAYNPETGMMATAGSDGLVKVWRIADNMDEQSPGSMIFLTANDLSMTESNVVDMRQWGEVIFICWSLQANKWVTAHGDRRIRVWTTDVLSCRCLVAIDCSVCLVTALTIHDPNTIVAALDDRTVRCFSLKDGKLLRTLSKHQSTICSVAVNSDYYISSSWDRTINIWSTIEDAQPIEQKFNTSAVRPMSA